MERRDYFISFNSADAVFAEALDSALRSAGFTTFYFPRDLQPGGNIAVWIDEALMNSSQILALYSPDYTSETAIYSKAERYAALWQDANNAQNKLIPILLRDTALTPLIAPISHVDVRGLLPDETANRVVNMLRSRNADETSLAHADALPKVFHTAHRRNPNFCGRSDELELLGNALRTSAMTAIVGLGGIGKSALATEYCHRFGNNFKGVWWVHAEDNSTMLADIAALGLRLGVVARTSLEADARTTLDHLASIPEPWLLVYDNALDADSIRNWLPVGAVRCIVTSRFAQFDDIARVIQLREWPDSMTAQYLLFRTTRSDTKGAEDLVRYLAGLPLAVEQAAAYLRLRPNVTFGEYARDIANLIKVPRPRGAIGDYPDTVYAVFVKSMEVLRSLDAGILASTYLCLFAFFSPAGVPLVLLANPRAEEILRLSFGDFASSRDRDDALAATALLSLARFGSGPLGPIVVYHRLVLEVARDWMGHNNRVITGGLAAHLVNAALLEDIATDTSYWETSAYLMFHAQSLYDYVPQSGEAILPLFEVLRKTALFYLSQGRPKLAIPFADKCVTLAQVLPGDNQQRVATALDILGGTFVALHRIEDAQRAYETAIQVNESITGGKRGVNDDIGLVNCIQNLSDVLVRRKRFVEAESLLNRASALMDSIGTGPEEENSRLCSLGAFYATWAQAEQKPEHLQRANDFTSRALSSSQTLYGERHPHTAQDYKNLAAVAYFQGNLGAAIEGCTRAAAIMLSLGLMTSYLTSDFVGNLIRFLTEAGQKHRAAQLETANFTEFLSPIAECEVAHRSWMREDPEHRHLGPSSFFAPRDNEPDFWPRALAGFDLDLSRILGDYDDQKLSSDDFARLLAEAVAAEGRR